MLSRYHCGMDHIDAQQPLAQKVYEHLLQLLGQAGYEAGSKLPGEMQLAVQFGVSRPVLRQALARLRQEGRVITYKGSGNFVADVLPATPPKAFAQLHNIPDIREFLEFRCIIETRAAALAAQWRTPDDLHTIEACHKAFMDTLAQGGDAVDNDIAFHNAIAHACRNRFLAETIYSLETQTRFSIGLVRSLGGKPIGDRLADVRHEHGAIAEAIARQQPEQAYAAMETHLRSGIVRLFG